MAATQDIRIASSVTMVEDDEGGEQTDKANVSRTDGGVVSRKRKKSAMSCARETKVIKCDGLPQEVGKDTSEDELISNEMNISTNEESVETNNYAKRKVKTAPDK